MYKNVRTNSGSFRLAVGTAFALLIITVALHWMLAGSGDKKFLLESSKLLLHGKMLYRDIFQPNFPLIVWLYAVPTYFSYYIGLTPAHVLILVTFCLIALSGFICSRLMKLHPVVGSDSRLAFWHSIVLLFVLVYFPDPRFFADREHLMTVLMLPYLLRSMPSLQKPARGLTFAAALMAAFAICIKPHVAIIVGGAIVMRLWRERSAVAFLNAETAIITVTVTGYLILMYCFTSEYFSAVLPMLLATYSANNKGLISIQYYVTSAFMLAVTLADFRLRHDSPLRRDILYLLGLCAFCLGYVALNNGWIYTFYPLNSIIMLLTVWVLWEFLWLKRSHGLTGWKSNPFMLGATACVLNIGVNILVVLLACYGWFYADYTDQKGPHVVVWEEMDSALTGTHARSFGTISTRFAYWPNAMENIGIDLATRFNHLWMLPKFIESDDDFARKHAWIPAYVAHAYADDLNHNKPDIMFVDVNPDFEKTKKTFDIIGYYSAYPDFAQAWKHYSLWKTIDHCNDEDIRDVINKETWCKQYVYRRSEEGK